jgi:hypothetical protein
MATTLFDRLGRPPPTKKAQEPSPAQKLLDWLPYWGKPTIRVRDIRIYGPRSLRGRESAIDSAQVLQKEGWLVPLKTRQRNMHQWEIVRKPIIRATVAAVADVAAE